MMKHLEDFRPGQGVNGNSLIVVTAKAISISGDSENCHAHTSEWLYLPPLTPFHPQADGGSSLS